MSTTARDKAWDDQMSLIIDTACECTGGVTVKGMYEHCGATAVAVRIDPDEGTSYEVCARHARHEMVPLVTVIDAAKDAGRASVLSALTVERIADLHARWHDQPGNMFGPDECGWVDCDFYEAVRFTVDVLIEQETTK